MIKKVMLLLFVAAVPFMSVSQTKDSLFTVRINAAKMPLTAKIYLLYQKDGKKIVDSATQGNGIFVFKGKIERPIYATLVCDTTNIGFLGMLKKRHDKQDALRMYIYPGQVALKTSSQVIANARFVGKGINSDYFKLEQILRPVTEQRNKISELMETADKANSVLLNKKLDSLSLIKKAIQLKFINGNPGSFIALSALQEYAGPFPDLVVIEPIFKRLSVNVRNMPSAKEFWKFLSDQKGLNPGTLAPVFVQNDTSGKPINLTSFRGKYVLIDFWASWCGPCRDTNIELVKIYNEFKGRNFTILGISLDGLDGKDAWLKAIEDDGLNWTQVSDLKHWENAVAKLYSIRKIPQSFLIDPQGVIIARDIETKNLGEKLKQVLPVE
ncbi:alkyl hydroperoxide reductase [Pedobacter sp. HMWF019]|uniref:TlpA disulfide reductase family protein n=1 Tax=Pedobacter sp. HMWF019 TaxID=2056856 RepID=UPI000D36002A|nr:TlpA disulfide reductase family protein [Pedobacter sp. HMWF019]PTS92073.1 alkyl hydroperoxide reductase [Pedobacter sp. HMWF019]